MRTAIFCFCLLTAPGLMAQSSTPLAVSPGTTLDGQSDELIVVTPEDGTLLAPNELVQAPGGWHSPLLAQNRPFAFAMPSPQAPAGRMQPIPTQWPNAKFEAIPTRWPNLKAVPLSGASAAGVPGSGGAFFVQAGRK